MELVNIPAYSRPHLLRATLACLARADEPGLFYRVHIDRGHDPQIPDVVGWFAEQIGGERVEARYRPDHPYPGPPYNTLACLHESLDAKWDLIHLVEDDILVGRDYFAFHRSAHRIAGGAFCASAHLNGWREQVPSDRDEDAFLYPYFQVWASSYKPDMLRRILQWAPLDALDDLPAYLADMFPQSWWAPTEWLLQDGLFARIREKFDLPLVLPCVPRAYHAGFHCQEWWKQHLTGDLEKDTDMIVSLRRDELNPIDQAVWTDLSAVRGPVSYCHGPIELANFQTAAAGPFRDVMFKHPDGGVR